MIESSLKQELDGEAGWRQLEASLRPFIAKRVSNGNAADDLLQEVLIKIHENLANLRDEQHFGPWVYQITRNAIMDHRRAQARKRERATPQEPSRGEPEEGNHEREMAGMCAGLFISLLPEPYREALTLVEVDGLTHTAAADRLGLSVSGMKSRVQRGRKKLRAALEACCQVALDGRQRVIGFEPRGCSSSCNS